ncbi:DNA replication ATP-dependent helicase/nuclease DNA2-like [Ctenocephalides felis]|uniref:DNA replication ATP-dependent helicase/nuclease DNA2-like n=1 Tax=Ctenocephalides felis TaxID=7515 RepID=UPI000E6E1D28|nr:DNA replication ATP-dependent helicase/nuclease DNA2-like [Ctenocephalides felis]
MSPQVPLDEKKHLKHDIEDKENCLQDFLQNDDLDPFLCDEDWAPQDTLNLSTTQRCVILHVNTNGNTKCIHLQSTTNSSDKAWCTLSFPWTQLALQPGDIISIKALNDNNKWIVNATNGLLVTDPDSLISGTSVVGGLFCARKGVLSEIYKGIDIESKIMTIGSLVHELYQSCIQNTKVDDEFVRNVWKGIMQKSSTIQMLYRSQLTSEEINGEIDKFVPKIVEVMSKKPVEVLDIEENLWVPSLGLKGWNNPRPNRHNSPISQTSILTPKNSTTKPRRHPIYILYILPLFLSRSKHSRPIPRQRQRHHNILLHQIDTTSSRTIGT